MSSTANVTVTVLDVNDNPPKFSGFKRLRRVTSGNRNDRELLEIAGDDVIFVPVYETSIPSTASPGSEILRVYATDVDAGRNGRVKFSIRNNDAGEGSFGIGERDGVVVFRKERKNDLDNRFELYVVATDEATPVKVRKQSVAVVSVEVREDKVRVAEGSGRPTQDPTEVREEPRTIGTAPRKPLATPPPLPRRKKVAISDSAPKITRLFTDPTTPRSLEIPENLRVPIKILDLREELDPAVREQDDIGVDFRLTNDGGEFSDVFRIDHGSGSLLLISSPDREQRSSYQLRVRAVLREDGDFSSENGPRESASKVPVLFYTLYLNSGVARGIEEEIVINVNIADKNDNAPEFLSLTREIMGAVDSRAELGERIAKAEAWDPDVGLNADLRYFIYGAGSNRFSIGSKSGEVNIKRSLARDAGHTFRLEVEARDRKGRNDALATRIGFVVHVLDSEYRMTLVLSSPSSSVERDMSNITRMLSEASGFTVRKHLGR